MGKAARAIIIEDGKILVMHRNKYGSEYYTLVGGEVKPGETVELALVREIKEETGLTVTDARLVYYEDHPEPYNQQYIYLCEIAPHDAIAIQDNSEEQQLNRMEANTHQPVWAETHSFDKLAFRTPQLQAEIMKGLKKGFPKEPQRL